MNTHVQKPKTWARVTGWIHHHRVAAFCLAAGVVIAIAGIVTILLQESPGAHNPAAQIQESPGAHNPAAQKYYSPLTGEQVADEAATKQVVTAIMIENSPDARPQSGIKDAGVVYEAIAEGGITRFLTLHQQDKPQLVGPVRSLRIYFLDWLAPYNASVAHVGGSADALAEVRNGSYRDIDQFFNADSYWRSADRNAPHNVYTSFEKLDALNHAKGYNESDFTGFTRMDGKPSEVPTATAITINFGDDPLYNTSYAYDRTTNTYVRSLAGTPHLDREKGQLTPSVVIAMQVDMKLAQPDNGLEDITTTGTGKATIFQNGIAEVVTWHKADRAAQISFTDAAGRDAPLVRGQTWIAAIPNTGGSVSWQ
jgi:hypothetical protein